MSNGILGAEACIEANRMALHISFKPKQYYLEIHGIVYENMSLAIVKSNTLLLMGTIWKRSSYDLKDRALLVLIEQWCG